MKKLFLILSLLILCLWQVNAENPTASATWALTAESQTTASLSGQLENAALNLTGLNLTSYGGPDGTMIVSHPSSWSSVEETDKYIEFSVSPKTGNRFFANEISIYVCGKGGSNMRANFYYSKDASFTTKTQISYRQNTDLIRDTYEGSQLVASINETIEAGEKIYFRIYPYYKSAGTTGKYICLKNAVISGTTEATEIAASVTWPFISDLKPVVSGALLAQDMSYGSNTRQYAWDERVTLNNIAIKNGTFCTLPSNCAWTESTTPENDIYVQYAVSPKTGATLTITNVSLMIAATGTNNMAAAIYASKDATFATKTLLKASTDLANQELQQWDIPLETPETVTSGETYYLRVYPFHKTAATYKLVGVRNVTISGTMIGATIDAPEVSTVTEVSYISTNTAIAGGTVSNDGGGIVTARGMVWSTSPNPTIADSKSIDGDGSGTFQSTLAGLLANTIYYTRAYATNAAGTAYGSEISFTTLAALSTPDVQTTGSSSIRNVSMIVSGKVTSWGGSTVTERGIVWNTEPTPTIAANKVVSGSDLGTFQGYIDGLSPETMYYVRAYATNASGTAYGNELAIQTKATDPDVIKVIAQDETGDYSTIQAAFDAVPSDYTGKWIIKIKPGTYNERPSLAKNKVNVYLIGEDAETTIITHNTYAGMEKPGGGTWGTSGCQTMEILSDDFMAVNITVENTYVNSKTNAAANKDTQAVALKTQGDRQTFYNCRIKGFQDTYLGNSIGRAYFKDCYIEGNVDFIFGRQTVVFDQCTTYVNRNGSVITAPSTEKTTKFGMVFLDCNLTAPETTYIDFDGTAFSDFYYGRPWQQQPRSAFIRCNTPATLNEKGWTTMNGGLNPVFVEYACTGEGATAARLSKRANEGIVLTEAEAAAYTIGNIFSKETDPSFAADWMPEAKMDYNTNSINPVEAGKSSDFGCSPNPFTDTFTVHYTLPKDAKVTIGLYNLNGVLLNKPVDNIETSGSHNVKVNASSLPAGVYFCTIKTGGNTCTTVKMIKR
ncbi:MAG: pectinesterase family protein [Dysgonomonas sp.]